MERQAHIPTQDSQAVTQARAVIGNELIDPEQATAVLLRQAEGGLSNRAEALFQRYKTIHFRLSAHAERSIAAKDAIIDPRFDRLEALQERSNLLTREIDELSAVRDSPKTSSKQRRQVVSAARRKLAELESIRIEMEKAIAPVDEALKGMEREIEIASPLWAGIQGADWLATKLHLALGFSRIQATLLRVFFFAIALAVALLIDRYTPFAESALASVSTSDRHDAAVTLLFIAQALLFEPLFSRVKKFFSWRVHVYLTRKAEELLSKIELYEGQMTRSEKALAELESRVP